MPEKHRHLSIALMAFMMIGSGCSLSSIKSGVAPPVYNQIKYSHAVYYHEVKGNTKREIARAMRGEAFRDKPTGFSGHNRWYVTWKYRHSSLSAGCEVTKLEITLENEMVLPKLVNIDSQPDLREEWEQFVSNLEIHEQGHQRHGILAAEEIYRALRNLSSFTCNSLALEISRRGNQIIEKYIAEGSKYDKETKHGAAQGAIWP